MIYDGVHHGRIRGHQSLYKKKKQLNPAKAFMTLGAPRGFLDTIVGMRAEGELGIQRDAHDFRNSLFRGTTSSRIRTCG